MRGPYVLTKYCVDLVVPPHLLGVFGLSNGKDSLEVLKRSEASACEEIKSYFKQYKYFWITTASSAREAFNIECEVFHGRLSRGNGKEDDSHPKAPSELGWHCPVCGK